MQLKTEDLDMLLRLKEITEFLAMDYSSQCSHTNIPNDLIPEDVANDWEWILGISQKLKEEKIISMEAYTLINKINSDFENVSLRQPNYDEQIWSDEGLKNHPFWNNIRESAVSLLDCLQDSFQKYL